MLFLGSIINFYMIKMEDICKFYFNSVDEELIFICIRVSISYIYNFWFDMGYCSCIFYIIIFMNFYKKEGMCYIIVLI